MLISKDGSKKSSKYNSEYNSLISTVVGEIFQASVVDDSEYIDCRRLDMGNSSFPLESRAKHVDSMPDNCAAVNTDGLGVHESIIFSNLTVGRYTTYVLGGDMGSGKTTTTSRIIRHFERVYEPSKRILIKIDFNHQNIGKNGRPGRIAVKKFNMDIRNTLIQNIEYFLTKKDEIEKICIYLHNNRRGKTSAFGDFLLKRARDMRAGKWQVYPDIIKLEILMDFVRGYGNVSMQIDVLMTLLEYIKDNILEPGRVIIVVDNIDTARPEFQYSILVNIMSMTERVGVKTLVPMRKSTFKSIENNAYFVFGYIRHDGPSPRKVMLRRVRNILGNWNSDDRIAVIPDHFKRALRKRLEYILVNQNANHVLDRIFWMSGSSIRHALHVCGRIFINNMTDYNKNPEHLTELMQAVIIGNDNMYLTRDDDLVANIYINPKTGYYSILCLRILQLVYEFENEPPHRSTRSISSILSLWSKSLDRENKEWTRKEIVRSINYLLGVKRPLLWVDSKSRYKNHRHMYDCDDVLHLTIAGRMYLKGLSRDMDYIQEAIVGVRWPGGVMPYDIDYSNIVDRINVIRIGVREIVNCDIVQLELLADKIGGTRQPMLSELRIISLMSLLSVSKAVSKIFWNSVDRHGPREEVEHWRSMLIQTLNRCNYISAKYSIINEPNMEGLEAIIDRYDVMLGHK